MRKIFILALLLSLAGCDSSPDNLASTAVEAPLPNFSEYSDVNEKKEAFFSFLLPLVHEANARILSERELIEKWQAGNKLNKAEQKKFKHILTKYRVTTEDKEEQAEQLLRRVQVIPPSLVLAQAANESAWGNSRFARKGNNLFGQWCFTKGCGIVPSGRSGDAKHEVQIFETPFQSVSSYMRNLNSHPQYKTLRRIREKAVQEGAPISGLELANGLLGYSERGEEYVEEIQSMIRFNKLDQLDSDV